MTENNDVNRERLATKIVEDWDIDTLTDFAISSLISQYESSEFAFYKDWANQELED
jgi:hypothetical protein